MQRTTTTLAGTTLFAAALLLTGCQSGAAQPSPEPTVTETATVTPTPSASPAPEEGTDGDDEATAAPTTAPATVSIPTDCTDIVAADRYETTFRGSPLNPEEYPLPDGSPRGVHVPEAPREGVTSTGVAEDLSELTCLWQDPRADITGISISAGHLDAAGEAALTAAAEREGATCTDELGGRRCTSTRVVEPYGADAANTTFVRDGAFVHVDQTNFPTDDLLGAIVARIWG